ncbi:uncharacterized protein [Littorina saxatilis]|uniref:uncharacterized protein n=1 Tax=Littorina saxatilis TaxID=31220 RepID=UPI0038B56C55
MASLTMQGSSQAELNPGVMMFRLVLLGACVAFCGACCATVPGSFPDALCRESILFRGAAIAETEGKEPEQAPGNPNVTMILGIARVFTVRVDQAFRMPASLRNNQTITIDPSSGSSVETGFTLNEDTLFAAYMRQSGEVGTNMCLPNRRWDNESHQLLESNDFLQYCANLDTNKGNQRESLLDDRGPPRRRHAALSFVTWFFSTVLGWETT